MDYLSIAKSYLDAISVLNSQGKLKSRNLHNFPLGACGCTCDLLQRHLYDQYHKDSYVVWGERNNRDTHVWLETIPEKIIIDITIGQYSDAPSSMYVGPTNDYYAKFRITDKMSYQQNVATTRQYITKSLLELNKDSDYITILNYLEH